VICIERPRLLGPESLRAIMPRVPDAVAWAEVLDDTLALAEATTVPRAAALLAQVAHESGDCRYMRELGDGKRYEGRKDLGNTEKGDGPKFLGRGLIQLTGRKNYTDAGRAIGLNLILHPELAETARVAGSIVAWYWQDRGLNALADVFDFRRITLAVNGGLRGWSHRSRYYLRALRALGTSNGV
jgi:putative chitinase